MFKLFGARNPRDAVVKVLAKADKARAAGRLDVAADDYQQASELVRALAAAEPGDDDHPQQLGSVLYTLGELRLELRQPQQAIAALDEAYQAYGKLNGPGAQDVPLWRSDVQLRRARAHAMAGHGASALVDSDASTCFHLRRAGGQSDTFEALDRSRVLAYHAEVVTRCGDPDVGVAAADSAVRTYLRNGAAINADGRLRALHAPAFARAARLAALVHGTFGRDDIAQSAEKLAAQVDPLGAVDAAAIVGTRAELLARMTLAAALERAGEPDLRRRLTAPPAEVAIVATTQRCGSSETVTLGSQLATVAARMATLDPEAANRIALEAHVMLAGASAGHDAMLRLDFATAGQPWARALLACSRNAWEKSDRALALDVAGWMGGVVDQLIPLTIVHGEARETAHECLKWHSDLLEATGDREGAQRAAKLVMELSRTHA